MESLAGYSKSMQQQKEGEQSKKIATQLTFILDMLGQVESSNDLPEEFDDEVQCLKDQLRRTKRIKINAPSPRTRLSQLRKANSKVVNVTFGQWQISLTTKTLESQSMHGHTDIETCSALRVQRAVALSGPTISVFLSTRLDHYQTITMHPIVSAYNQVNSSAEVFQLVVQDDVDALQRLILTGEASLRDCDEEGRSLLQYACYFASVNACAFLVSTGADVDRSELLLRYKDLGVRGVALVAFRSDQEADSDDLKRSLVCRKILFQAGADPTVLTIDRDGYDGGPKSMLVDALGCCSVPGSAEPFSLILRESAPFFDVRYYRENGMSLWERACRNVLMLPSSKVLEDLVKAGSLIAETDGDNRNCLFHCVTRSNWPNQSSEFAALRFLLIVFNDIFAQDRDGFSIFDHVSVTDGQYGSYQEDMWYCAIYRSRLESRFGISPPHSPPMFTSYYNIGNYRALLYLDTWNFLDPGRFMSDYPLANRLPLSPREREQAPAFCQWDASHLVMMEETALSAHTLRLESTDESSSESSKSSDEWETESEGEEEAGDWDHQMSGI